MPKAKYHTQKEREQLPTISGHFTERVGLQRAYYPDAAMVYVQKEREMLKLDEKDRNDKIKLETQYQSWLKEREIDEKAKRQEELSRSTSISNQED